jgi:aquaporin Z
MEIYAAKENKLIVFVYEMMGTAMLVYAINMQYTETFGVFGIAFMLFAWLLIGGPITGAHFNPAVTVGVYISNKHWQEDVNIFLITLVAEFTGGILGIMLTWGSLYNETALDPIGISKAGVPLSEVNVLMPNANSNKAGTFQVEMICTFMFVMINLIVKTRKTSPTLDGFLGCFAVALTLLAMIIVSAMHSGGCLNPAVGLA